MAARRSLAADRRGLVDRNRAACTYLAGLAGRTVLGSPVAACTTCRVDPCLAACQVVPVRVAPSAAGTHHIHHKPFEATEHLVVADTAAEACIQLAVGASTNSIEARRPAASTAVVAAACILSSRHKPEAAPWAEP